MSSKHEKDKQKALQEKYQAILYGLLRDEDNKYCVDCDAKGPRWASWNLGVFLCIRCAGIHRNLGVHVSRVKSVNLDAWTEEQVAMMKEIGNSRGRAVYEANIPDNFRRPQIDSSLESFIRAKYEQKKYIASEWVPPKPKSLALPPDNNSSIPSKAAHNSTGIRDPRGSAKLATFQAKPLDTPKIAPSVSVTPTSVAEKGIQEAKNGEIDLLGLDDPLPVGENCQKDIFGEFLSSTQQQQPQTQPTQQNAGAPDPSPPAGTSQSSSINPNDTSLFDTASSATALENKKVSKDAILALYGPTPASGPAVYGGGLMIDPSQSMMGHMALIQGQQINGQIPLQPSMMIGQPAMMGGVSMAAMMNPQVPLLMGGAPQIQGQINPNLYNIQQIQNQMVGLNLASPHQTQPAFYHHHHQQQQQGAAQPGFYQTSLPGQQFFQHPQQNSNMFQSPTQQGVLSYPGNSSLAVGVAAIPNVRPAAARVPGWSDCLPHQPAQPPMTGNFWQ